MINNIVVFNGIVEINGGTINATASSNDGTGIAIYAGTLTINGGTIKGSNHAIYGGGEKIINGGTISLTSDKKYGSVIYSSGILTINKGIISTLETEKNYESSYGISNLGTLTINGGIIKALGDKQYGIYNGGTLTVIGGEIIGNTYGINNIDKGTLTLGENGEDEPNTETPKITGGEYGVKNSNSSTFNFYDGIITGKEGQSISGMVSDKPEGYSVIKYKHGENADFTVEEGKEIAVLKGQTVAHVASTGKDYGSLKKALLETSNEDTITLLNNAIVSECLEINADKNIILDLAGYEITSTAQVIENAGNLKIVDNGAEGKITTTAMAISNSGTLEITGGTITGIGGYSYGIYNNAGTVQIKAGTVKGGNSSYSTDFGCGIYNNAGTITIEEGTVTGYYGIYNDVGIVEIINGIVGGTGYGINNKSAGTVEIKGGTINSIISNSGILTINGGTIAERIDNEETGTLTISEGTIYSINNLGTATIEGGTLTGTIFNGDNYNRKIGVMVITGGTIKSINNYATLTVAGGTISVEGYSSYGICNYEILTVTGGTISVTGNNSRGIRNYETGILTLGENDEGTPNVETPLITGQTNGVYNNGGIFKFYDGRIVGPEGNSIYGTAIDMPEEYSIMKYKNGENDKFTVEEGKEIAVLEKVNVAHVESTNKDYGSLKEALAETLDGSEDTIILLTDVAVKECLEIGTSKNITLDLAGHEIASTSEIINNAGNLKIEDSGTNGKMTTTDNTAISNSGTLEMVSGTISGKTGINNTGILTVIGGTISGSDDGVENTGTLTITGGTISGTTGISNDSDGIVTITNANVTGTDYGIWNSKMLTVNSGTIKATSIYGSGIVNTSSGTTEIKSGTIAGGKVISYYGGTIYGIGISNEGILIIDNGTIIGHCGVKSSGTTTVNGGNINGEDYDKKRGWGINNTGTFTINAGNITSNSIEGERGVIHNTGTLTIKGGEIKAEITGYTSGIYNSGIYNSGTLTIDGGRIKGGQNASSYTDGSICPRVWNY